jgi:hypothetical protein
VSELAQALAERFERANAEVIAAVERWPEEAWRATPPGEEWSVGLIAHHIGNGHAVIQRTLQPAAAGQSLPPPLGPGHNERYAREHADCTREEVLDQLRRNGASAAGFVRGLRDEELDRPVPSRDGSRTWRLEEMVERLLIGHVEEHLASIRRAESKGQTAEGSGA